MLLNTNLKYYTLWSGFTVNFDYNKSELDKCIVMFSFRSHFVSHLCTKNQKEHILQSISTESLTIMI